jgi:hypothetical protein
MKKYFLHDGEKNIGPFTINELKDKKITKETPIWYEGLEDWTTAGEVEDLNSIFLLNSPTIPPIKKTPPPIKKVDNEEQNQTIFGLKKNLLYPISGIIILIVISLIFNLVQENKKEKINNQNIITERENQQYIIQQQEIEAQKKIIAEKERQEAKRIALAKKQKLNEKKIEIEETIADFSNRLKEEEKNLVKAKAFQLFRTAAERKEDISLAESNIEHWKGEIQKLQEEIRKINQEIINLDNEKILP